jgi:hypothetical protein
MSLYWPSFVQAYQQTKAGNVFVEEGKEEMEK